jgi:hypothetical protein
MSTTAFTPPPTLLSLPEPRVHIDYIALTLVACLLLLGMVMVGSAFSGTGGTIATLGTAEVGRR